MNVPRTQAERHPVAAPAPSLRRLLTPRWIAFTIIVVLAVAAFLFLAWWQLSRFESTTGSWQNLGYTLQWPFFAAFAVYLWWKLLRDPASSPDDVPQQVDGTNAAAHRHERIPRGDGGESRASGGPLPAGGEAVLPPLPVKRPVGSAARALVPKAVDPELEAYNDYLVALHSRSRNLPSRDTGSRGVTSESAGAPGTGMGDDR
jgi:DNA-binding transcriptional regulator of glucitol operon